MSLKISNLPEVQGSYRENVLLSKTTWFNVGGYAEIVFRPKDTEDLAYFIKNKGEVNVTVLGVCSNILVRDGGIEGVTIKFGKGFTDIKFENQQIHAGVGALGYNVARFCQNYNFGGLEFLSGIPGTIGGALFMNAGAYGSDVSGVLDYAEAVDEFGQILKLKNSDIGYIYRGNTLPEGIIFTKAVFNGRFKDAKEIEKEINNITSQRKLTQPVNSRTGGSTFKNPPSKKAWELIDEAGMRGHQIGGARISDLHCNFIINTGDATANDIEMLGNKVKDVVKEKTGIELNWEIKIIGKKL